MALGGGGFTSYNKVLPGTYINFISSSSVSHTVGDRGVCAVSLPLSWGAEGEMFAVTAEEFMTNSTKHFGYGYTHNKMKQLRDLFMNASLVYVYRLGEGTKAANTFGTARYSGVCGNDIKIRIAKNLDDEAYFDVTTYYKGIKKDLQKVKAMADLDDNDFIIWDKTAALAVAGSLNMTGGTDATVTGEDYQKFLDASESVRFNTLAVATTDDAVNSLVAAYTKRMREERGIKFQSVLYKCEADDIGVINVDTQVKDDNFGEESLVWFVAGATAGCAINKSLTNRVYDGCFEIVSKYTQSQLEEGIAKGRFMLHAVDGEYRVLSDINSLVNTTAELGEVFCENQTVRIVDQIAYDDATLFKTKYLGCVPNDEAGRLSLWNDIVEHRKSLQRMRAIENFKDEDVVVEKGSTKTSVIISGVICPINSMSQLYITTEVE
ncbi:MAG: phage tail sheath family protein [Clostridia bacterium]|nr:phage tail sheath family protein [Clostridia bacterium]